MTGGRPWKPRDCGCTNASPPWPPAWTGWPKKGAAARTAKPPEAAEDGLAGHGSAVAGAAGGGAVMSGSRNATAHLYGGRIGDGRPHTPSRPAPADGTPASTPGATPPLPPRSQGLSPTTGRATSQVSFADLVFLRQMLF